VLDFIKYKVDKGHRLEKILSSDKISKRMMQLARFDEIYQVNIYEISLCGQSRVLTKNFKFKNIDDALKMF
jgi:hypothetical protein